MSKRPAKTTKAAHPRVAPIFLVGAPRSGLQLLKEQLSQAPGLWSPDDGAPDVVDNIATLHPRARGWESGRLVASDVTGNRRGQLADMLAGRVRDRDDRTPGPNDTLTVLDHSFRHALRVPFLASAFPKARFVYVYRDAGPTIASMSEAWRARRYVGYPMLPDWPGPPWTFALVEGWRDLAGRPIEEIAARQWAATTATLLADLDALPSERWASVTYEQLTAQPQAELERLCAFLDVAWDRELTPPLPLSGGMLSPPRPDKWRERDEVQRVLPLVHELAASVQERFGGGLNVERQTAPATLVPAGNFSSTSTPAFNELLRQAQSSLLISTYQSGRLIVARLNPQDQLNTHYRAMPSPMGIAVGPDRFAVGTNRAVTTYRNHSAIAPRLAPQNTFDAVFLPIQTHMSGDIRIHEMEYVDGELWAVSTRFSCLVTFDENNSFTPRWKPPFVSAITAEDRCHLNGLALDEEGRLKFVTALGVTDRPGGWRDNKASGGVVIDIDSGEVVVSGLSMPHSPRIYDGWLWVLESGKGTLSVVDLETGELDVAATLPGFTRGLTFVGPYAVIGLSQVRESIFRGLPIAQQQQRECGVWVVDTRTGDTAGFLHFDGVVQEIFDVKVLPGLRWPEIGDQGSDLLNDSFLFPPEVVEREPSYATT